MSWHIILMLFAPLAGGVLLHSSRWGAMNPRLIASIAVWIAFLCALFDDMFHLSPLLPHLGVLRTDSFSITLALIFTFVFLLLVTLCPRNLHYHRQVTLLLLSEVGLLVAIFSDHLLVFALGCFVLALPVYFDLCRHAPYKRLATLFLGFQVAGLVIWGIAFLSLSLEMPVETRASLWNISVLVRVMKTHHVSFWTAGLFGIGLLLRLGMFPFHVPLVAVFKHARYGGLIGYVVGHVATASMLKFVGEPLTHLLSPVIVLVHVLFLLSAVYFALISLSQFHLRHLMAYQFLSFLALGMLVLISPGVEYRTDSLIEIGTISFVFSGLLSMQWLVETRMDIEHIHVYQGVAKHMPGIAIFFLLIAMTSVGLPGTIGLIAEDLLLQKGFHFALWEGAVLLLVLGLNGWVMFRMYARLFLGADPRSQSALDMKLTRREQFALLCFVLFIILNGFVPDFLLRL